jgi:hypothetical protein
MLTDVLQSLQCSSVWKNKIGIFARSAQAFVDSFDFIAKIAATMHHASCDLRQSAVQQSDDGPQ